MKQAAIVRFIDDPAHYANGKEELTNGKYYNALFVEFFGIKRNNLWIINDKGEPGYFYNLEDFEIIEDKDSILKDSHAIVRCVRTHRGLTVDKKYRAIGKNDTDFLVFDDYLDTTFYPKECFKVIQDTNDILSNADIAYDWSQIALNDLSSYKTEPVEILCHCQRGKKHE